MVRKLVTNSGEALEKQLSAIVDLPKIAVPFTTITNRAQCTDFSQDLMPRMGVERIMVQGIREVQGEIGPAGERVFKPINDPHDQIRIYGPTPVPFGGSGAFGFANNDGSMEITFYGTGVNIFCLDSGVRSVQTSVDGGALSANFWPSPQPSSVIFSRGYAGYFILSSPNAANLSLGLHTVRFQVGAGIVFCGFEILNEAAAIKTPTGSSYFGGRKLSSVSLNSQAYNSDFESGTLGTKGGRVIVYQKSDGSIAKAVQPTDTTQLNLNAATHTNEELIRSYNWREFGCGRADDFSTLAGTSSDRAFTLDDGTTTLLGNDVRVITGDDLNYSGSGAAYIIFTFVGTGLDVTYLSTAVGEGSVTVDNVVIGTMPTASTKKVQKIVSGLPYGTHVVKFLTGATNANIGNFLVYGPKKPSIPSDAVELADYYLMGDHTSLATESVLSISSGVLRKHPTREALYSGAGWIISSVDVASPLAGFAISTTGAPNVGNTVEYTFVGTGIDFRVNSEGAATYTITVDGSTNFTVSNGVYWSGALTTSTSGGALSFTPSTGVFSGNTGVARITLEGMNFTKHTIKIALTSSSGGGLYPEAFDIITPIHSPKSNLPGTLQNTLTVGSNSIGDSRVFSEMQDLSTPNWVQVVGATSSPSTTSTSLVPIPDMLAVIKSNGMPLVIDFNGAFRNASAVENIFRLYVDGVAVGILQVWRQQVAGSNDTVMMRAVVPVSAGVHVVQVYWAANGGGTLSNETTSRILTVQEMR